jgi:hypothetical protein
MALYLWLQSDFNALHATVVIICKCNLYADWPCLSSLYFRCIFSGDWWAAFGWQRSTESDEGSFELVDSRPLGPASCSSMKMVTAPEFAFVRKYLLSGQAGLLRQSLSSGPIYIGEFCPGI